MHTVLQNLAVSVSVSVKYMQVTRTKVLMTICSRQIHLKLTDLSNVSLDSLVHPLTNRFLVKKNLQQSFLVVTPQMSKERYLIDV